MINLDLAGKRAFITGSSSGIGYAIAKRMAQGGAAVVVHGRTEEHVVKACARLSREVAGSEICGQVADLTDAAAVGRLIEAVPKVDILVNNAGSTPSVPFFEMTDEQWQRYSDTYILGAVRLARHYLAKMIQQGWGRILFSAGTTCSFTPGGQLGRAENDCMDHLQVRRARPGSRLGGDCCWNRRNRECIYSWSQPERRGANFARCFKVWQDVSRF